MNLQEVVEAIHLKNSKKSKKIAVISGSYGNIKHIFYF
jgi:hypothetical protein